MDLYKGKIPIINRSLNEGWIRRAVPEGLATGAIPRDFSIDPVEMRDSPAGMKTYKRSEWSAILAEVERFESSILHLFLRANPQPTFLDQNGFPDCWYYGPSNAYRLACLRDGQPIPEINATAGATLLGRTSGGWSGLAMKDLRDNGAPIMGNGEGEWPKHTRRGGNSAAFKANRLKHKVLEDWYDLGSEVYDQEMTAEQIVTCSVNNNPGSGDWNRHGHAMCIGAVVEIESGSFGPAVWNSWLEFGYLGWAILREQWPNNAVFLRSAM